MHQPHLLTASDQTRRKFCSVAHVAAVAFVVFGRAALREQSREPLLPDGTVDTRAAVHVFGEVDNVHEFMLVKSTT